MFFKKKSFDTLVPADVPGSAQREYITNYQAITKGTGHCLLFSCDQKIEHLHNDFFGSAAHADAAAIEHLFAIATQAPIGAMATHLGLLARYGMRYHTGNYIVKLNGKSDIIPAQEKDPYSGQLWSVADVIAFKKQTGISVRGVGYTIYLGSEYEDRMLTQAAQLIFQAHQHGLVAILWIYPRGKHVTDDTDPLLTAGAAGVAAALGTDFVKIKPPHATSEKTTAQWLAVAAAAAGNCKILCAGGPKQENVSELLQELYDQMHTGKTSGVAIGRNIFQRPYTQAIALATAVSSIVYDNVTAQEAYAIYEKYSSHR